jgi:lysophospholipase
LWPLIQPERSIDVIIVNDNSQDTNDFWPNGTSLYSTYSRAQGAGLTTMPLIPLPEVFLSRGYHQRPTFFGCYDVSKITIVYLPNKQYSFPSNIPDWTMKYSTNDVAAMLQNGNQVATFDGNEVYKTCFACVLLWKTHEGKGLPLSCHQCMETFCFRP